MDHHPLEGKLDAHRHLAHPTTAHRNPDARSAASRSAAPYVCRLGDEPLIRYAAAGPYRPVIATLLFIEAVLGVAIVSILFGLFGVRSNVAVAFAGIPSLRPLAAVPAGSIAAGAGGNAVSIATGPAPQVIFDDEDAPVRVEAWDRSNVQIDDRRFSTAVVLVGKSAPLNVDHSGDVVRITRPDGDSVVGVGGVSGNAVVVHVPRASRVEIASAASADVAGVQGSLDAKIADGPIHAEGVRGAVNLADDDGSVSLENVDATTLAVHTSDGGVAARNVRAESLDVHSGDGTVDLSEMTVAGTSPHATIESADGAIRFSGSLASNGAYVIHSEDGAVAIALPRDADLTVGVHTSDGELETRDGITVSEMNGKRVATLGGGRGGLDVTTDDGGITLMYKGAR